MGVLAQETEAEQRLHLADSLERLAKEARKTSSGVSEDYFLRKLGRCVYEHVDEVLAALREGAELARRIKCLEGELAEYPGDCAEGELPR
jgi:hypothetical protein